MPHSTSTAASRAIEAAQELSKQVDSLDFNGLNSAGRNSTGQVAWIYNPLDYAWEAHQQYLQRFARSTCRILLLGMNPGPWGMAQTGVPFGEIAAVRDWLGIDAVIGKPQREHPKRPIDGLGCKRSEVSGKRLWGLFAQRFGSASTFFDEHFVANYCPLVFMEESARNITPDKLPAAGRQPLEAACDEHLAKLIRILEPEWIIGVGAWAEGLAKRVIEQHALANVRAARILHPSPASPAANQDWSGKVTRQLEEIGVWK